MGKAKLRAVAVIVENPMGEILILKEFESKPQIGKYAGMSSIPMETIEEGEDKNSALLRLIKEELPGLEGLQVCPIPVGSYRVVPGVWASLYVASTPNSSSLPAVVANGEVGEHRWVAPAEALGLWLRQGAREMIANYISGAVGVIRACAPISAPTQNH